MARMRTIKPGYFTNELLADVPPLGRILFAGLWCHADRKGRLEDRPRKLKVEILPYDDCDIDLLLEALAEKRFIVRYAVGGACYIQVVTFSVHQSPHKHERASTIPPPPGWTEPADVAPDHAGNDEESTGHAPDMHPTSTVLRQALTLTLTDPDPGVDRGAGAGETTRSPAPAHATSPDASNASNVPPFDTLWAAAEEEVAEQGLNEAAARRDLRRFRDDCIKKKLRYDSPEEWGAAARHWLSNPDFGPGARSPSGPARGTGQIGRVRLEGEHAEHRGDSRRVAGPASVAERINAGDVGDPDWANYEGLLNPPRRRSGS